MRVVIIPEDFRNDQYILKPLVEAMLAAAGRPRARVTVCRDPVIRGVGQALDRDVLAQIIERYSGMTDLFLLCVDRDGVASRRHALEALEVHAAGLLNPGQVLLGENAWQELEVWALAGSRTGSSPARSRRRGQGRSPTHPNASDLRQGPGQDRR
jgi:hypothetical protein